GTDTPGQAGTDRARLRRAFGTEPALAGTRHSSPEVRAARLSRTPEATCPVHRGPAERPQRLPALARRRRIPARADTDPRAGADRGTHLRHRVMPARRHRAQWEPIGRSQVQT